MLGATFYFIKVLAKESSPIKGEPQKMNFTGMPRSSDRENEPVGISRAMKSFLG